MIDTTARLCIRITNAFIRTGIIREARIQNNIVPDAMSYTNGNPSQYPEAQLGNYDLVFAVGQAALESLAIGTAPAIEAYTLAKIQAT